MCHLLQKKAKGCVGRENEVFSKSIEYYSPVSADIGRNVQSNK